MYLTLYRRDNYDDGYDDRRHEGVDESHLRVPEGSQTDGSVHLQQEVRIIRYAPARTSEHPLPYPAGGARPHESLLRSQGMS